jgi:hypothetical protein
MSRPSGLGILWPRVSIRVLPSIKCASLLRPPWTLQNCCGCGFVIYVIDAAGTPPKAAASSMVAKRRRSSSRIRSSLADLLPQAPGVSRPRRRRFGMHPWKASIFWRAWCNKSTQPVRQCISGARLLRNTDSSIKEIGILEWVRRGAVLCRFFKKRRMPQNHLAVRPSRILACDTASVRFEKVQIGKVKPISAALNAVAEFYSRGIGAKRRQT